MKIKALLLRGLSAASLASFGCGNGDLVTHELGQDQAALSANGCAGALLGTACNWQWNNTTYYGICYNPFINQNAFDGSCGCGNANLVNNLQSTGLNNITSCM